MADEAAATPGTEAAPVAPTDAATAKSFISQALARQAGEAPAQTTNDAVPPNPHAPKAAPPKDEATGRFTKAESAPRVEGEPEAAPEQEAAEDTSEQQDANEDQGEQVEVPDTIQGLAEQYGVDPEDLLGHLRVEVKGEDGKPVSMSIAEALRGTLREQDYTRKNQQLAEQRREHDSLVQQAQQALSAKHQQLDSVLNALIADFQAGPTAEQIMAMADPNSPTYNPTEYVTARAQFEQKSSKLNNAMALQQQQKQEAEQALQQKRAAYRQQQQQLLTSLVPEATDKTKLVKFEADVRQYMMHDIHPTAKFSQAEVDSWFQNYDARQVLLVRDAMAFRAMSRGKDTLVKTLKGLPKVSKPNGTGGRTNGADTDRAKSLDRLRRPGASKDDALKFLKGVVHRT